MDVDAEKEGLWKEFSARGCFVSGSAKSGTTLLVALLDGHPQLLAIPEETAYFPTVRRKFRNASRMTQADYLMETAESRLLFEIAAVDRGNRDYRTFPRHELRQEFTRLAADPRLGDTDLLALLARATSTVLARDPREVRWWIEKTPANRWCIPDIQATYPHGCLLFTMRDPRSVAASILQRAREKSFASFSLYLVAKYWIQSAKQFLYPPAGLRSHGVRYEQLVLDPQQTMRDVSVFLGIDFLELLTHPTKAGIAWKGNSTNRRNSPAADVPAHPSTTPPRVDTRSLERWREELPGDALAFIEYLCGPWMDRLDYRRELTATSASAVWQKFPWETAGSYIKDRRRYTGDLLTGFFNLRCCK